MRLAIITRIIAMGCSSSKPQPPEEKAVAASKPTTGRRGFGWRNNKDGGRNRSQPLTPQKQEEDAEISAVDSRLARSPSFRYYCDDVVVVVGRADEHKETEERQ